MLHRIRRSFFLIVTSISPSLAYPGRYDRTGPTSPHPEAVALDLAELPLFLAAPHHRAQRATGEVAVFIPDVIALTAPFLLYRLKRTCLSHCRVIAAHGGLLLHARL